MSSGGISVVLCCAHDDEPHLAVVAEHLRREGIEPRVLAGVNEESQLLGAAVDAERGRALFVACKSNHLGPAEVLRLEGTFGARKGPSHRFVGVRLSPENPLAMVKDIRTALTGFASSAPRDVSEPPAGMREVVNVSSISAVGSDARSATSSRERIPDRETPADPLAIPMHGRIAEHAARVPAHQSGGWRVDQTHSEKKVTTAADDAASGPASLLPEPRAPGASKALPMLLGAILVSVLGVGYLLLRGQQAASVVAPTPASPAPATTEKPAAAKPLEPDPVPLEEVAPDPEREPERNTQTTGAAESASVDEATAIAEAIANGDMRALDLLLILDSDHQTSWRKAVDHCRLKRVNGVKDWRLPTLPELKKLRSARLLKSGRYWSGTRPAATDDVYVLDRDTRRVELVPKDEEGLSVLCVRQH